MARRRRHLYWVAGSVLIMGLVYASLPWVLASWLRHELGAQGWTVNDLEVGYPGWRRIKILRARIHTVSGEETFHLNLENLELEYRLPELVKGRGRRLYLPQAVLMIRSSTAQAPETTTPWPLPGSWVTDFPLQELIIDRLNLEWSPATGPTTRAQIDGRLERRGHEMLGEFAWADERDARIQVSLMANETGELRVVLYHPNYAATPALRLAATLIPSDKQRFSVSGVLEARPGQMASLPQPLAAWVVVPPGLRGTIRSQWEGTLVAEIPSDWPALFDQARLKGRLALDLKFPRLLDLATDVELRLDMQLAQETGRLHFKFADNFRLAGFPNVKHFGLPPVPLPERQPTVVNAPHGFSAELNASDDKSVFTLHRISQFAITGLRWADGFIPQINLVLSQGASLSHRSKTGEWSIDRLPLTVTAAKIVSLVPLKDLHLEATLSDAPSGDMIIDVNHASVDLLGGTVTGESFRLNPARTDNRFTLRIKGLDIGQIVALEQHPGLTASGRLDGQLPVHVSPAGIRVIQGQLHARPPGGVIRYAPDESAQALVRSNANLDLVIQALSNLHYENLEADVDYLPVGDLKLGLRLRGMNPNWNQGQPIHLNVSLEENIPKLWQSLRLSEEIRGKIERRVQEHYKKNK